MRAWTCFTCCSLCLKRRVDASVVSWHLSTFRIMLLPTCFLQGYHPRSTQRSVLCSWWQAIDGSCCSTYDKFYQIFYLMVDVLFEHCSNVDTLKKFCKGGMNPAKSVVFPNWMIRDWCMHVAFFSSFLGIQIWNLGDRNTHWNGWIEREAVPFLKKKHRSCWDMLCGQNWHQGEITLWSCLWTKHLDESFGEKTFLSVVGDSAPVSNSRNMKRLCAAKWNCYKMKLIGAWNGIKMNQLRSVSFNFNEHSFETSSTTLCNRP